MRKPLLILLAAVAAIVVVAAVVVAMQPSDFRVSRTATLDAPADKLFQQVNDFHNWQAWSPWAKLDPAMKVEYDGPPAGMGAIYHWAGNAQVGEGRATIVESRPNEFVRIQLDFVQPMAGTDIAEFAFRPSGDKTEVTWSIAGKNGFLAKAVNLIFGMEETVGGMFEQGLADLNTAAKTAPAS